MPITLGFTSQAQVRKAEGNPYHDDHGRFTDKDHVGKDVSGWKRVGPQGGSNPGGVFEDEHGTRHYVKFPQRNPEQAQAEKLADSVYDALGIPVKHSEVVHGRGKIGLAGQMLEGAHELSPAEINKSPDVQKGYVADAYLANWDVFGMSYDNILRKDGKDYRIDNGGTTFYRAQGEPKNFPADRVDELQTLIAPGKKGQKAFGKLTPAEIQQQAHTLISTLTDDKIAQLIAGAGITGERAKAYQHALVGRRNVIASLYTQKRDQTRYIDALGSARRRKRPGQNVPMDIAAINAAMTAANS